MSTLTTTTETAPARLRLWQLISPTLPVGAYAYSQGLEHAVAVGWVSDENDAAQWITGLLQHSLSRVDAPLLARMHRCWRAGDGAGVTAWSRILIAARETAELRAEDRQMGAALARLLQDLDVPGAAPRSTEEAPPFAAMFALGAAHWAIPERETVEGYLWAWTENQVAAAIKLVPLGQTAGQRLLLTAAPAVSAAAERALQLGDEDIGASASGLAIASALHETQYSRLFRS
jgi:urease accessory protein